MKEVKTLNVIGSLIVRFTYEICEISFGGVQSFVLAKNQNHVFGSLIDFIRLSSSGYLQSCHVYLLQLWFEAVLPACRIA